MFDEFKTIVLSIANIELPLLKSSSCKHVKSNRTNKNKINSKYLKLMQIVASFLLSTTGIIFFYSVLGKSASV